MGCARTKNDFKLLLSTALFLIFLAPILLVTLIFLVFRTLILIILKVKFGSKFGGLISGLDAYFSTDLNARCTINIIMIVKTQRSFQEFFNKFKETMDTKIFQNPGHFPKFLATRHKMCGYHYIIPNQVEINKCVRICNFNCESEEMTKEELLKEVSHYSNQPLPYDNTGFWEFLVCEKPVIWNNRIDKTQKLYAVLLRFHHSLADGVTFMNFFLSIFSVSYEKKADPTVPTQSNALEKIKVKLRNILDFIFILLITPMVLISQIFFRHVETSSINGPPLSDEHTLVVKTEESSECLRIIKKLKLKVEDTSFLDILSFAISKSFSNYFQKKGKDPNLTCLNAFFTILMNRASCLQTETKDIRLRNMFSYFSFNIPIVYNNKQSFMETLEKIKIETKPLKASPDYKVTYGILRAATYIFPESVVVRLVAPPSIPLLVSNIPGPSALTLFGDSLMEDVVFWIPRVNPIGLSLGFFSYDKRLQIGLSVDKVFIPDPQDAQDIVDGIYHALIELDSNV